jgi:putative transposon-encoded protein
MDKRTVTVEGYEMLDKVVAKSGNSGYIYAPARWVGKRVVVILTEPLDTPGI